jgi:tetratricopeptide (TPR) repeat protein
MNATTAEPKTGPPNAPVSDCLVSWKEIAAYFKREVRTLQRWEKTEGLPVRRHYHSKLATVYAYRSELDVWRASRERDLQEAAATASPRPTQAHVSYLKGRYCWTWRTTERFQKAIDYFEEAIAYDPRYALAHAGLADAYNSLWFFGGASIRGSLVKAKEAALRAIALDENLAEAHASLARALTFDWDWAGAEREFRKAIQLNADCGTAHHWYADFLSAMGRHEEALDAITRAQDADPLSLNINSDVGGIFYLARQYDRAVEHCKKTLEIDTDHWVTHWILGCAYYQKGVARGATAEFEAALQLSDRNPIALASLANCLAAIDRKREARKLVAELEESTRAKRASPYHLAVVHARSGAADEALRCLKLAYKERASWMVLLKVDPQLDSLRADPRFGDLLRRVGLER